MVRFIKEYYFQISLLLILSLAVLLRFPYLSIFPPSMLQDEVSLGYSAISIAETGKDEWGYNYPIVFKSFGDNKPPAFFYTTALIYKIVGWQSVLPRITSALAGIVIVLTGTLWIEKLFQSKQLGLIAGLILATNPWSIHLSRMALESNLGLAFFITGLLFFTKLTNHISYKQKENNILITYTILSSFFFSLSTYSYHAFRFSIILLLSSYILFTTILNYRQINKKKKNLKHIFFVLILSTLLSLPGFLA